MERIENFEDESFINRKEHEIRYKFAKQYSKGTVLDIACGIGYGSNILLESNNIDRYYGVDVSEDAISKALFKYKNDMTNFKIGSIKEIDFTDSFFDTIISYETLEHIDIPDDGLREISRVLKKDGIFIGSVPTREFDELVEKIYGKNEYHISKFDLETLQELLSKYFKYFRIFTYSIDMTIGIKEVTPSNSIIKIEKDKDYDNKQALYGSYFFICSNDIDIDIESTNLQIVQSYFELIRPYQLQYKDYNELKNLYEQKEFFYNSLEEKYKKLYDDYLTINNLYNRCKEGND